MSADERSLKALTYTVSAIIYNLYFHPLAKFPGPILARASLIWRFVYTMSGNIHLAINKEHQRYGTVFRVSPNELSFSSVTSWKAIYGHQLAGRAPMAKSEFYQMYGAGFESLCIGSERSPQKHLQMKKNLSNAFSTKALLEQEQLVGSVIDAFVTKVGQASGPEDPGLNMTKWYEMVAFDILGEMAFGESFGSIEKGTPHSWAELILDHLYLITLADNLRQLPFVTTLTGWLFPSTIATKNQNSEFSRQQVAKRLKSTSPRKDFMTQLVGQLETGAVGQEELTAHASTLVIAGGETVSTFLAATTYYLLMNPASYKKLVNEIRQAFSSYAAINTGAAQALPYLQAVINEGLRIYPPGSQGFPRLSPGAWVDEHWIPKGTELYTSAWTVTHDARNFHDPMAFKPDRWLADDYMTAKANKDIKEASQPFSLGPRACLGRNFAYMEMNLILAKMLWRYDLELVDKELDWLGSSKVYVMWWKPELRIRFKARE